LCFFRTQPLVNSRNRGFVSPKKRLDDDGGNPFQRRYYNAVYRELADACSVPKGVWNMKARHGGATEARQSGALLEDTSEHLQHSNIQTTTRMGRVFVR
jgi:hypothetical protein